MATPLRDPDEPTHHVLLVESPSGSREGLATELRRDFWVTVMDDGREAWDWLESGRAEPAVVAVIVEQDIASLPGIELLRRLQSLAPDTVRVLMSRDFDAMLAYRAIEDAGVHRLLMRPANPFDLRLALRRLLEAREREIELLEQRGRVADLERQLQSDVFESFIRNLGKEELQWFVNAVKGTILSDARLANEELDYLRTILGFLPNRSTATALVQMIRGRAPADAEQEALVPAPADAFAIAVVLIRIAVADGQLIDPERAYLRRAFLNLGFDEQGAANLLAWAEDSMKLQLHLAGLQQAWEQQRHGS